MRRPRGQKHQIWCEQRRGDVGCEPGRGGEPLTTYACTDTIEPPYSGCAQGPKLDEVSIRDPATHSGRAAPRTPHGGTRPCHAAARRVPPPHPRQPDRRVWQRARHRVPRARGATSSRRGRRLRGSTRRSTSLTMAIIDDHPHGTPSFQRSKGSVQRTYGRVERSARGRWRAARCVARPHGAASWVSAARSPKPAHH